MHHLTPVRNRYNDGWTVPQTVTMFSKYQNRVCVFTFGKSDRELIDAWWMTPHATVITTWHPEPEAIRVPAGEIIDIGGATYQLRDDVLYNNPHAYLCSTVATEGPWQRPLLAGEG